MLAARFEVSYSLLRDSYIISYFEAFVKGFCKSFLSFFEVLFFLNSMFASLLLLAPVRFRLPFALSLDATFILYHIFLSLSRGFAKVFEVFFVNLSGSDS